MSVLFGSSAHQIGQVYCGGCSMLLMYRFGSRAVKCSNCKCITQITVSVKYLHSPCKHISQPPVQIFYINLHGSNAASQPAPSLIRTRCCYFTVSVGSTPATPYNKSCSVDLLKFSYLVMMPSEIDPNQFNCSLFFPLEQFPIC